MYWSKIKKNKCVKPKLWDEIVSQNEYCIRSLMDNHDHIFPIYDIFSILTVFKISARPRTLTGKIWVSPASFSPLSYINFGKIVLLSGKFQILFWRLYLPSLKSCSIHLRAISHELLIISTLDVSLKITNLRLYTHLPGTNGLMTSVFFCFQCSLERDGLFLHQYRTAHCKPLINAWGILCYHIPSVFEIS